MDGSFLRAFRGKEIEFRPLKSGDRSKVDLFLRGQPDSIKSLK